MEFLIYTDGKMNLAALLQQYRSGQSCLLAIVVFPYQGEIAASIVFLSLVPCVVISIWYQPVEG